MANFFFQFSKEYMNHPRIKFDYMSMGMSHDYLIAIEEGANMVRLGSSIFKDT